MRDVSSPKERKVENKDLEQAIALLKKNKEQLLCLVEVVSEGLIIFDKAGKITFVNSRFEKFFGIDGKNIIGSHYIDPRWSVRYLDSPAAKDDSDSLFERILKTGETVTGRETILEYGDGKVMAFSVSGAPLRDDQGEIAGVVMIFSDVTEQNRIKEENKEIKDVYERLTNYADEAIFRIKADSGQIIYANEAAQKIFGYSLDEYLADPRLPLQVINKDYLKNWVKATDDMVNGKDVLKEIVMECTAKDGRTVIMEFTSLAVRDQKNKIVYFESLGRDITIRRFMEAELAKTQNLESIGLLAGGIAHDFNNILTALLGCLSLAKMEVKPENVVYGRLVSAEAHCMKAKSLTRRLLTYSLGGSPTRKTTYIAQVLREAANSTLSGKNVKCKFDLPDGLWPAQIDEGQMNQVVHSLTTNAVEAMPDGGTIEIGAQNVTLKSNAVPALKAGCYVKWYVRDHGVGISSEHMKKLFDPYFTTKQLGSVKGMGLELAICYSIVKSHEGMITVDSKPGMGTTFTVHIPALNDENENEAPLAPKCKVLLIDDEKILLDVTSSMLAHLGYEVATAQNHRDALEIYRQGKEAGKPFSLIIMDLTMRGDEGGEIAIRKWLSINPEVKTIISSGYANDPVIEQYWKYGFAGAMIKPYSLSELKNIMEKALENKGNSI